MFDCELKFCMEVEYAERYEGKKHGHPCWELVYYLDGEGTCAIADRPYKFTKNMFALISPDMAHAEAGNASTKVLYIGFNILDNDSILKNGIYDDADGEIYHYLRLIHFEMQRQGEYSSSLMNHYNSIIIIKVTEKCNTMRENKFGILDYAVNYINLNYMNNISVKELASFVGYSYDYFRKIFLEYMKISVKDYIEKVKFHNAQELLFNSDKNIKSIAYRCGYSSPAHFCMIFKKKTGHSPYSVRKKGITNQQLYTAKDKLEETKD